MITLLARIFIKDRENYSDNKVRGQYGFLCGMFGIFLNVLLFAGKFAIGTLTGSVAIQADAANNLSDAGSSVVTLLGFKLANKKVDAEHPFGHGRIEYISGLIVAMFIVLMGFEIGKTSFDKILHPESVQSSVWVFVILTASILIKLYMAFFNRKLGKKLNSVSLSATSVDSISDCCSTFVVLLCTCANVFLHWQIDGICGLAVALFILFAGIKTAMETIKPLLGAKPDRELIDTIEKTVMDHEEILGIHDLIVHDYGPGRTIISLHAEVNANDNLLAIHDTIDNIERELKVKLGFTNAVIHMDPIEKDNEKVEILKNDVLEIIKNIDPVITMHDFRVVFGETHTNLVFDVVVPADYKKTDEEVKIQIAGEIEKREDAHYFSVIEVDRAYS